MKIRNISLFFILIFSLNGLKAAYIDPWNSDPWEIDELEDEFAQLAVGKKVDAWKKSSSEPSIKKNLLEKKEVFWSKIKKFINDKNYCNHRVRGFLSIIEFLYNRVTNIDNIVLRGNCQYDAEKKEKDVLFCFKIESDQVDAKSSSSLFDTGFKTQYPTWEEKVESIFATIIYETINEHAGDYSSLSFIMQSKKNLHLLFRLTAFFAYSLLEDICVESNIFKFLERDDISFDLNNESNYFWQQVKENIFNSNSSSTHRIMAFCEIVIFIKKFEKYLCNDFLVKIKTDSLVIKMLKEVWPKKFDTQKKWEDYLYELMESLCVTNVKFKRLEAK